MRRVPIPWRAALVAPLLAGCAHVQRPAPGWNVSSEHSDYSPTLRLAVALPLRATGPRGDTLAIVIDSGVVLAPGRLTGDTLPIMRNLYLTALIATSGAGGATDAEGQPAPPWHAVAEGDSVLVVRSLRLGEPGDRWCGGGGGRAG